MPRQEPWRISTPSLRVILSFAEVPTTLDRILFKNLGNLSHVVAGQFDLIGSYILLGAFRIPVCSLASALIYTQQTFEMTHDDPGRGMT